MATRASKKARTSSSEPFTDLDVNCVNSIRVLAADVVEKANSGHPGAPMGCAPMAHILWSRVMNYDPQDPTWPNRDRFILSNGHACALQYSMLHLTGYNVTINDLQQFRQLHSITPGHPENGVTPGVEVSTGPLGQGISNAVGVAIAERHLAAKFNQDDITLVDHYTYVICGDGCLQEGVSSEACSLAGHLGLGKIIVLYDDNKITIDGETDLSFTEDVLKRYEAYGWHVQEVSNGDEDLTSIYEAIEVAKSVSDRPSIIKVRTTIGLGSSKQGTEKVHGAPLGASDVAHVKEHYGFDPSKSFVVSDQVRDYYNQFISIGAQKKASWHQTFEEYKAAYADLATEFERTVINNQLPENWESLLPTFTPRDKALATRKVSEMVIASLWNSITELVGGSADLTPSNLTRAAGAEDFQKDHHIGRYIRFGVREHGKISPRYSRETNIHDPLNISGMAAISNGIAAHGGLIPFCATFLNFAGYALGSIRLSALSHFRVIYVMTHDSIGLGEDGPTHQPVEMINTLRAIPNMLVLRPADGNEVSGAYRVALSAHGPSIIALSRQGLPQLEGTSVEAVERGAYVIQDSDNANVILIGTGSEVSLCIEAAKALNHLNVKVVSMPSWELFEAQTPEYKHSVLPEGVPVVSVEAAHPMGWERYSHYHIGMKSFGASAPGDDLAKHFGFTKDSVVSKVEEVIEFYKSNPIPAIHTRP